jgi:hypothetical protein
MSAGEVKVTYDCSRCVGFGAIAYFGDADVTCPDCGGSGRKRHRQAAQSDLLALVGEAVEALSKYGRHRSNCRMYVNAYEDCTCGLTATLAKLRAVMGGEG